ncbi:Kazal-type serine protease inhibitor domain-containing protein [Besnoitia besnoiti]|uniref:Kazal-type serine protease inhibitor domain-containing protein n=1 Tax=Besnoitia besnoiti TaxID=94643 RepID=A0A2A9MCQ5_BESBE|nr:Kazal-type serine protease inhibitor domain-containing protein [Besnoitia besnoiti]PFH33377.1 Kazal-type serine protease inhibitor domain-containing protein [Besnoitia besnoiti]
MSKRLRRLAAIIAFGHGCLSRVWGHVLDEFGENAYNDVYEGECECPPDVHIICGKNGKEYINPCYAMCDGTLVKEKGHCSVFHIGEN